MKEVLEQMKCKDFVPPRNPLLPKKCIYGRTIGIACECRTSKPYLLCPYRYRIIEEDMYVWD